MAGINTGIAKNINMFATDTNLANIEVLLSYNIDVLEVNWCANIFDRFYEPGEKFNENCITEPNPEFEYSILDRYYDHIVSQHNITTVAAAGNWGDQKEDWFDHRDKTPQWKAGARVSSPAMGYNVLAVSGYDNNNTGADNNDDYLLDYSWKNNYEGMSACEKPDVVQTTDFPGGGTSSSSPAVTAQIALMMELKPSLSLYPQAVKAIVLASCHRKVSQAGLEEQETMQQGITERQGAGVPDTWTMACIVSQGTYGTGILNDEANIDIVQPPYGAEKMNVSITWIKENYIESNHTVDTQVIEGDTPNVNLSIYQNDTLIDNSTLANSSTEMCYIPLSSNNFNYRLKLSQISNLANVRYGYAWSTNDMCLTPISEEGIYYIKNASTENSMLYSTINNSNITFNNLANQNNITDTSNWIVTQSENIYNIKSGYSNVEAYLSENLTTGGVIADTNPYDISLIQNDDGSYYLSNIAQNKILCYNNSSYIWNNYNSETDVSSLEYKWYLYKINYLKGDTNMDGSLDDSDITALQEYIAGFTSPNNNQFYLSNLYKDEYLDVDDVTELQFLLGYL